MLISVSWDVTSCSLVQTTRCHNPEGTSLHYTRMCDLITFKPSERSSQNLLLTSSLEAPNGSNCYYRCQFIKFCLFSTYQNVFEIESKSNLNSFTLQPAKRRVWVEAHNLKIEDMIMHCLVGLSNTSGNGDKWEWSNCRTKISKRKLMKPDAFLSIFIKHCINV